MVRLLVGRSAVSFWVIQYRGVVSQLPIYWTGSDLEFSSNADRAIRFFDEVSAQRIIAGYGVLDGYPARMEATQNGQAATQDLASGGASQKRELPNDSADTQRDAANHDDAGEERRLHTLPRPQD
jgi:hypothetical protein